MRLQASARRVTGAITSLKFAFSGLIGVLGTFFVGKIFGQIFGTATDEAIEARQRTRSLIVSLNQMQEIQKRGKGAAQEELQRIYKHNAALEERGVIQDDLLNEMAVILARAKIPSANIQEATDKMADLLVATVGVTASQEDAKNMAEAFKKAVSSGKVLALQRQGVDISKEQAKEFSKIVGKTARFAKLMKILGDNYKNVNEEARNTPEGRVQRFRNLIDKMADDLGEKLLPAQAELADAWREALPEIGPLLVLLGKGLLGALKAVGKTLRTQIMPWWRQFQKSERFQQIKNVLGWMLKHWKAIAITLGVIVGLITGLSVLASFVGMITAIANPIGLIVIGVLAIVAAVTALYLNWDKVKKMFPATAAIVEHFIKGFKASFKAGFDFVIAIWKSLVALFTGDWKGVGEAWKKVWDDMGAIAEWWKTTLIEVAKSVGKAFKDYFLSVFEDIKTIWTWMKGFSWEGIKKSFAGGIEAGRAYGETVSTGQAGGAGGHVAGGAAAAGIAPAMQAAKNVPLSPTELAEVQAERAEMIADLQRPELRNLVSATLATEKADTEGQKDVLEAMVNRAVAYKRAGTYKGMEQMIKGGFYGPYNRGVTAGVMAKGLSPERAAQVGGMIGEVGAGRNVLGGLTDQGMINEIVGASEKIRGEYYGLMGGGSKAQRATAAYKYSRGMATGAPTSGVPALLRRPPPAAPPQASTSVNFTPNITINGNATEAEQRALDSRLRDLARDFVGNFKRAQTHERRLSYEGGYG